MSEESDVCLLNKNPKNGDSEVEYHAIELNHKKRILKSKTKSSRVCPECERSESDPGLKRFKGPPDDATEEEAALTDVRLQLYDDNCLMPEVDSKPVHRLTKFSVFDGEGHLCEFDTGLIEKNKKIFCSGHIKPIYDEDSSPEGGVPAQEIGPIELWWISGFDGGNNFLIGLASPCAEYILMDPSEEYEEYMKGPRQKALLTKIVVEFLSNSYEPSFEELLTRIQEVTVPKGELSFDENTLQQHAQFVVEQLLEIDDEGELVSTPAVQELIQLYNVKIKRRNVVKRRFEKTEKDLKLSRATMTPLVSDIFENFFSSSDVYFNCDQTPEKRRLDIVQDSTGAELSSYSWEEGDEFAVVNDKPVHKGDFVCISVRDSSVKSRIFRIEYFFHRNFTKQAHCSVYCSGVDTVIGESSNPLEFYYVGECGDWPLCKIIRKLDVVILEPPNMSQFYEYRTNGNDKMFVQKKYVPDEGRFEDFSGSCRCSDGVTDALETFGGVTDSSGVTTYEKIKWRNGEYSPGCCVFIEPFAVTLDAQKSSRKIEKIVVTLKADERIYPEIYRKGKEIDSAEECPEPFKIAYVKKIYGKSEGKQKKLYLKVNKFYRPEDTGLMKDSSHLDLHLLFWSEEEVDVELDHVRGLCDVTYSTFSREFGFPDEFYFQDRFDHERKSLVAMKEVELVRKRDFSKEADVRKLRTMNVFCGSGGLAEGLRQSGVADVIWGIEIEDSAARAFKANFPNAFVYKTDCNTFLRNVMNGRRDRSGLPYPEKGEVDFICGGPPCQGFSTMNRFTAKQYSQFKNSLIVSFLSFCDYYRPKYFLLENVKNFVAFKKSCILKYTLSCLITMGYQCSFAVLQAGNYGVPQNRKRLFIIASAPGVPLPKFPPPTHVFHSLGQLNVEVDGVKYGVFRELSSSAPLRAVTIRDALFDLPPILRKSYADTSSEPTPYQRYIMNSDTVIRDHVCREMTPLNEARIKHVPAAKGCDWRDLPNIVVRLRDGTVTELLQYPYHDVKQGKSRSGLLRGVCPCASGKACNPKARQTNTLIPWCLSHTANRNNNWTGLFGRLDWDGFFSTTITNPDPSCKQGRVLHPEEDRIVSIRECARSQGLPDSFRLHGSVLDKYRQVGNSVPPPMARAIGYEIKSSLLSLDR
ncbi:UNVERIFIED_CONTAM: hypothetical protein PYX00_009890 [Menopon gallinae]|uniref:Cytosine-specific methyltransferase n=1 Tax=Menopon gallinae TaxID=328185 RepID=A0AAW2HDD6_9NEOP